MFSIFDGVYKPSEDSFLLVEWIKKQRKKWNFVLDIGSGSGIEAIELSKKAKIVFAIDVFKNATKNTLENAINNGKRNIFVSNISFEEVCKIFPKDFFDLIVFNPPYLPKDENINDNSIYGGEEGFETLLNALKSCKKLLKRNGSFLGVLSSLSNIERFKRKLKKLRYSARIISEKKLFFETIYLFEFKKKKK